MTCIMYACIESFADHLLIELPTDVLLIWTHAQYKFIELDQSIEFYDKLMDSGNLSGCGTWMRMNRDTILERSM